MWLMTVINGRYLESKRLYLNLLESTRLDMKRSSHQRCSVRKNVRRNLAKFTGKHLCHSLFFNKVAGLKPATLLRERL